MNEDSKIHIPRILGDAYAFTYFNPTGHYRLNLAYASQRIVAETILLLDYKHKLLIEDKQIVDKSKHGNQSCFRNEKFNEVPFVFSPDWELPTSGVFEFDFVHLDFRPLRKN